MKIDNETIFEICKLLGKDIDGDIVYIDNKKYYVHVIDKKVIELKNK